MDGPEFYLTQGPVKRLPVDAVIIGKAPPMTDTPVQITDLYARRTALRRELAGVEQAIERCHCTWAYTPPTAFEDRLGDRWVRVSYRTCVKCGLVCERVDENPREGLGLWQRTAKFKKADVK